jgi:xylan 1,4-beta-xylosidase
MTGVGKDYAFFYRTTPRANWTALKEKVDGNILSMEASGGFVGAMLGIYARAPQAPEKQ